MKLELTALALVAAAMLSGCTTTTIVQTPLAGVSAGFVGSVHGGRQPIANATISLYQTGTTGYGVGASQVTPSVMTNSVGIFSFPAFSCTAGTQIYLVSTGGDPYGNGENNVAATLMEGLTSCNNISSLSKVSMNEVTTVSTVWALAPFMNGTNIGATGTNQTSLSNAFLDIATLIDIGAGSSPGPDLPLGTSVPSSEINTLANVLVSCVNSVDSSTTTSTACANLFSNATSATAAVPTDTVSAALNIARNPGANVAAIIASGGSIQAFEPTIASASDLTIGVTYMGDGIAGPSAIAVDGGGNVWIANATANSVTELSHTGVPLSGGSGYTAGALSTPSGIAIDPDGNAWITNSGNSTLTKLSSSGANASNSPFFGGGLSLPSSVAIDGFINVFVANAGSSSISEFSYDGTAISGTSGYTPADLAAPIGIAIDPR